jgi:uncharacterized membrane protein YkoI
VRQAKTAKALLSVVAALAAGTASALTPAAAGDRLAQNRAEARKESVSRAEAIAIARRQGVDRIQRIEYVGNGWLIEGFTRDGRRVEMMIDARTGQVGRYRVSA